MDHYPFATQDWSLIRHRTLALDAAQIRAVEALKGELWVTIDGSQADHFVAEGDSLPIHARSGRVVIEAVSSRAMLRAAIAAQSPLTAHIGSGFGRALSATLLRPIATALCRTGRSLQRVATYLDPKLARA